MKKTATLMDWVNHFNNIVNHGMLPDWVEYHLADLELQGWLETLGGYYFDVKQLYWNALYIEDEDERLVTRYTLRNLAEDLIVNQYMILTYGRRAIHPEFKAGIVRIREFKQTLYEYMKALGRMQ